MLNRMFIILCVLAICAGLAPIPGAGQGQSGKGKDKQNVEREDEDRDRDDRQANRGHDRHGPIVFTPRDRDIIRNYFRNRYSNLPPGLAKRGGNLPPGLQRQLERNGTLPPGLQKRLTPFPADLTHRLTPLPSIYQRGSIGTDVLIVDTRTQRIIDIVRDILHP